MSEAGKYDFTIYKGATNTRVFTFKDASNNPINLTGYTADFKARPSPDYGSNTISKTGLSLGGAAGTVTLTLDPADTATIGDSALIYSIVLKMGSDIFPFLNGKITVSEEVLL